MLAGGGAVLLIGLVFVLVVDPLLDRLDRAERQTIRKQKDLQELAQVGAEHAALNARLAALDQRLPPSNGQFSILAFLEEAAAATQLRDRITAMQPQTPTTAHGYQEKAVDVRLDGVQLPQLLNLLTALEKAPYDTQVSYLQIKPAYDNPVFFEANVRVVTYAKAR